MMNNIDEKYTEYARNVLNGNIIACDFIKLACQRYLDWMDRNDMEFRPEKADKPINFGRKLKHFNGSFADKPLNYWNGRNGLYIRYSDSIGKALINVL